MYTKLSKATTYGHAKKPVAEKTVDHGRPRKISSRDKGLIFLQIPILRQQHGSFTISPLRDSAKVMNDVSGETVSRAKDFSFYIDAAGFHHEYNPPEKARSIQTMAWQLKNESLHHHCTAKGSYMTREEK